jgi:hypothetical protein
MRIYVSGTECFLREGGSLARNVERNFTSARVHIFECPPAHLWWNVFNERMLESIGRTALLGMWEANFGSAVRRELPIRKGNLNSESDSGFFIKWGILYRKHVTDLQYLSLPLRRHQISSLPPARSCSMRHSQYFVFPVPEYISLWQRMNFIHSWVVSRLFMNVRLVLSKCENDTEYSKGIWWWMCERDVV